MLRKQLTTAIAVVSILMFSSLAWSSIVGPWDVQGTVSVKVSIQGAGSDRVTEPLVDEFVFDVDGTFQMIGMAGVWSQSGSNFVIELDPLGVESDFEDSLAAQDFNVDATVTSLSFKGKESKDGSAMKGKFSMKMDVYFLDLGAEGTVSTKTVLRGLRASGPASAQSVSRQVKSFPEAIAEKVRQAISAHGVR